MTEQARELQTTTTSLEEREAEARIEKLDVERQVLSLQLTRRYERRELLKTLAGLGGLLAAIAAIGTFLFSTLRWQQESSETRRENIEKRFDNALERLGRDSSGSRLGGVVSLKSFLSKENKERHSRVLLSLSHALAIERDPIVRDAIVEVFSNIDIQAVDQKTLEEALNSLAGLNRAFYREGKLNRHRAQSGTYPKTDSLEAQAQSTAAAIVALIKKGARIKDLSSIYCVRCDFSKMNLNSTNFDDAILERANFEKSILADSSFNRADLEFANFVGADLTNANLRIMGQPWYQETPLQASEDMTLYSWDRLDEESPRVLFPNFACANLEGADFSGRPLGINQLDDISTTNFQRANLRNVKLKEFAFLIIRSEKLKGYTGSPAQKEGKQVYTHRMEIDDDTVFEDAESSSILDVFTDAFAGTNWQQALLANGLMNSLTKTPPSEPFIGPCSSTSN